MNMSFSVKCKTSGAGTFQIVYSPNGYTTGASGSGSVDVLVALPGGGTIDFLSRCHDRVPVDHRLARHAVWGHGVAAAHRLACGRRSLLCQRGRCP